MLPPGTVPLPADSAFQIDPPLPLTDYKGPERAKGLLLGFFGTTDKNRSRGTHAVVVNLDYKKELADSKVVPSFGGFFGSDKGRAAFVFTKGGWFAAVMGLPEAEADAVARPFALRMN